jgi:hypothetical protein
LDANMKFAKYDRCRTSHSSQTADIDRELERDLVPEWRLKYLDYKVRDFQHTRGHTLGLF